ncbi:unnamed protein product [Microthlaspi erraticum]|uniref:F-box domain-containing protein n=1 Tax=Microthlaspi erraticum TaxID=1685480 RepID=A0A6D2HHR5_9BRAS|nr:unnamed protein product [Microthlaspi erraticum]
MESFTEDLWEMILARLPLKSMTSSKLVCKQWKAIVESPLLRKIFDSHHQNSQSSWSLMDREHEVMAHYGCEIWGLSRSLGSYISFLNEKFETEKVRYVSYTEVGLMLIGMPAFSYYVANPISRQCVELPPIPLSLEVHFFGVSGLVTRIENGLLLGYKVVLVRTRCIRSNVSIDVLIYSSEAGLWSFKTIHYSALPVSLKGKLYWRGMCLDGKEAVVSHDFYAESEQCLIIHFPDSEKNPYFRRAVTASQGFIMYINSYKDDLSLRVWRLKSGEWQIVSEILLETAFDCILLGMNPFDANKMYFKSDVHTCLTFTNLLHKGAKFGLKERSSFGHTLSFEGVLVPQKIERLYSNYSTFFLPRWLYRIPSPPS